MFSVCAKNTVSFVSNNPNDTKLHPNTPNKSSLRHVIHGSIRGIRPRLRQLADGGFVDSDYSSIFLVSLTNFAIYLKHIEFLSLVF